MLKKTLETLLTILETMTTKVTLEIVKFIAVHLIKIDSSCADSFRLLRLLIIFTHDSSYREGIPPERGSKNLGTLRAAFFLFKGD